MRYKAFSVPRDVEKKVTEIYRDVDGGIEIVYPKNEEELVNDFLNRVDELNKEFRETYKAREIPKIWGKATKVCKDICDDNLEALSKTTRFPEEAIEIYLVDILSMDEETFRKIVESELNPDYIDDFQPSAVGYSKAYGPKCVTNILQATPGPQIISSFQSSVVKSPSIYKPSSEEPLFTNFWIESLKEVDPSLEKYLWVVPWKGGREDIENKLMGDKNSAIIVYGDENTVEDVKSKAKGKVLGYPTRMGFEVIDIRKGELSEIAQKVAKDVAYFDQLACFSPHNIYVLGDKEKAKEFCTELSKALEDINIPRSKLSADTKAVISMLKATCIGEKAVGLPVEVYSGNNHTVIYEEDPSFQPSCLYRVVRVKPLDSIEKLPEYLKEYKGYFQTIGTNLDSGNKKRLADLLQPLGVSRITEVGRIAPKYMLHHEGNNQILPLLKWVDIEEF